MSESAGELPARLNRTTRNSSFSKGIAKPTRPDASLINLSTASNSVNAYRYLVSPATSRLPIHNICKCNTPALEFANTGHLSPSLQAALIPTSQQQAASVG